MTNRLTFESYYVINYLNMLRGELMLAGGIIQTKRFLFDTLLSAIESEDM